MAAFSERRFAAPGVGGRRQAWWGWAGCRGCELSVNRCITAGAEGLHPAPVSLAVETQPDNRVGERTSSTRSNESQLGLFGFGVPPAWAASQLLGDAGGRLDPVAAHTE